MAQKINSEQTAPRTKQMMAYCRNAPIFNDGSTTTTSITSVLPSDYVTGTDVYMKAVSRAGATGAVSVRIDSYRMRPGAGSAFLQIDNQANRDVTFTVASSDLLQTLTTVTSSNIQAGDVVFVSASRLGGSDANAGTYEFDAVYLEYTGRA